MPITVAVLRAVLGLDDAGFQKKATAAERTFDNLASKAKGAGLGLSLGLTAPLALAGKKALDLAANFEQSMNVLRATTGATADQMRDLSKLASQLGADIDLPGTSAKDAADAMLELSKAGLSVNDTMKAARSTLQLSAAAQVDNARAAEIVGDALNTFSLEGDKAQQVADLLAGAANASTGSIDQMAAALSQSGTSFREVGVSVTDAVTAISLLAKAGIKGQDAGTSLKTALMRLNPTTKESQRVMSKLGITFFDANGKFVGMQKAADTLNKAMAGLSQQNRMAALEMIGGSDAMRALSILARNGGAAFEEMRAKVGAAGQAASLAAAQNSGLKGAIDAVQSSIETALEAAVRPFIGDITKGAKKVAELIGSFNDLDEATRKNIVLGAGAAALAGPILLGLGQIAIAVRALLPVFAALRVAAIATWAAVSGPLAPLVLLIGAAAVAIALAWETNFGHIREATAAAWGHIKGLFSDGIAVISGLWSSICAALTGNWAKAWDHIKSTGARAFNFIKDLMDPSGIAKKVGTAVGQAVNAAKKAQQAKLDVDTNFFPALVKSSKNAGEQIYKDQMATARKQAAQIKATYDKAAKPPPIVKPSSTPKFKHVDGMFDKPAKAAKAPKESPQEQQMKTYKAAIADARLELKMLMNGSSDMAIQVAKQFDLVGAAKQKDLATHLQMIEAKRKERQELEAADQTVTQLAVRYQTLTAKGLTAKKAFELFGVPLDTLTAKQRRLAEQAATTQKNIDDWTASEKKANEVREESARLLAKIRDVMAETNKRQDLLRDGSAENVASWDLFDKSIRNVSSDLAMAAVWGRVNVQVMENIKKRAEEVATTPLTPFAEFMRDLGKTVPAVKQSEKSIRDWASAQAEIGSMTYDLKSQLDQLKDPTIENALAWQMFGVSLKDLDLDLMEVVFGLGDLQREIDATKAKTVVLDQIAADMQGVFYDALGNLDQGFGGFFDGVIAGFDQMLQDMAKQWLSAAIMKLIFGALGADTSSIDSGPLGSLFGGGRAKGGDIDAGKFYLVGENGPELVGARTNGTVHSNEELMAAMGGRGGGVTVVQNIQTADVSSFQRSRSTLRSDAFAMAEAARRRNG